MLPTWLDAVIVYKPVAAATEGVPVMIPDMVLIVSPAGNAGDTEYDETFPVTVGFSEVIAVPTVRTLGLG